MDEVSTDSTHPLPLMVDPRKENLVFNPLAFAIFLGDSQVQKLRGQLMETHLRYRIEKAEDNLLGTLEILRETEDLKLPLAGEVLTLQNIDLAGTFQVLRVDGPFHHSVDKVSYVVRLLRR